MMVSVPIVFMIGMVVPGPSIVARTHTNHYRRAIYWRWSINIRRRIIRWCRIDRCGDPYVYSDTYTSPASLRQHCCPEAQNCQNDDYTKQFHGCTSLCL